MAYPSKPWYHNQEAEVFPGKFFRYDSDQTLWVRITSHVATDSDLAHVKEERDSDFSRLISGDLGSLESLTVTGVATYGTIDSSNSNLRKLNQVYYGNANGSYFTNGEYQKIVTIIPANASENYQVSGRILAQSASNIQTIYFDAALRSETLPNLTWSIRYRDEHNGTRFVKPQLWTKETSTAGFIFAFQYIHGSNLYGTVTVDMDLVPRSAGQKNNITINNDPSSEQTSVDSGYTANDFPRTYEISGNDMTFDGTTAIKVPGPYANDSAASSGGVAVGEAYYKSDGQMQVRIS